MNVSEKVSVVGHTEFLVGLPIPKTNVHPFETKFMKTFILQGAYGDKSLMPGNFETILELYKDTNRSDAVRFYSKYFPQFENKENNEGPLFVKCRDIIDTLVEIVQLPVGAKSRCMRWIAYGNAPRGKHDPRPPVFIQEEWKSKVLMWLAPHMFQRHIQFSSWESIFHHLLLSSHLHPETEFDFFGPWLRRVDPHNRGIEWCYEDTLDQARKVYRIEKWFETPPEPEKTKAAMKTIIDICNAFSHHDVRYEIVELKPT